MLQRILDAWNSPRLTRTGVDEIIMWASGVALALILLALYFPIYYKLANRKKP